MSTQAATATSAIERAGRTMPAPGVNRVDIPVPYAGSPAARPDDLSDLIKRFNGGKPASARPGATDLIVFVSFSMPARDIEAYSRDAKAAGAVLVLRGFKNESVRQTTEAAAKVNPGGVEWEVHPELFKQYRVTKVPTIVLADASKSSPLEDGCASPTAYVAVSGDLSIEVALRTMARRSAQPGLAKLAEARITQMRRVEGQ